MAAGVIGQAAGLFAVTNIDDIVILALFFAQGAGQPRRDLADDRWRSTSGSPPSSPSPPSAAFGARFLPRSPSSPTSACYPWPWASGRLAGMARPVNPVTAATSRPRRAARRVLEVAAVTFANGGDNIGVYVPVFTTAGPAA